MDRRNINAAHKPKPTRIHSFFNLRKARLYATREFIELCPHILVSMQAKLDQNL
jgi:hypothetical protein